MKAASDVHVDGLAPHFLIERLGGSTFPNAGIADEIARRPTQFTHEMHRPFRSGRVGNITGARLRGSTGLANFLTHGLQIVLRSRNGND